MWEPWGWAAGGAMLGLIAGSLVGALVVRWPQGRGLGGRSACDRCGRTLGPAELIPLVSAFLSGDRCRSCRAPIDPVHRRAELGCALTGAAALGVHGAPGLAGAVLGWMLVALALLDHRHWWLPDRLTVPVVALGLALGPGSFASRLGGAVAAALALAALAAAYLRLRGREGLGAGDIKLASGLGAWVGASQLPLLLLLASTAGLAWALIHRQGAVAALPLGLFLAPAGWLLWLVHG